MKVIVVGGVAGGASAAARIRRLDEAADVVVYERSGYISYANCGLLLIISAGPSQTQHSLPYKRRKVSGGAFAFG